MNSVRGWAVLVVLDCLLLHSAQVFWIGESGLVQLQLKEVWLRRKLSQVCQERVHGRRNCFRQIVASRHNNNRINRKYLAT